MESVEELGISTFVSTKGLLSNNETVRDNDTIHYSRKILYELGNKYSNAFIKLTIYTDRR